jgi:hypothetical protein
MLRCAQHDRPRHLLFIFTSNRYGEGADEFSAELPSVSRRGHTSELRVILDHLFHQRKHNREILAPRIPRLIEQNC